MDRLLNEIASIRSKYSAAVFELEKCKEKIVLLESKDKVLVEETEKLKINAEKSEQTIDDGNSSSSVISKEKSSALHLQISELKKENSSLKARLKQAEYGIEQKRNCTSDENNENDENGYEIEKLLKHRKKIEFLVRWKGYGPEDDTWETESHLSGTDELLTYKKKHRM